MSKKKSHGGLKFLAFLAIVATLIIAIKVGVGTEAGQRIVGHREDRRVERTSLTPRFSFAAATAQITIAAIYTNSDGTTVDLTSTRKISIDRESGSAMKQTVVSRTPSQVSPGVDAVPVDGVSDAYTEVLTRDYRYESPIETGQPWTRHVTEPSLYGTELDPHYIPMIDDIMGFELRDLPAKPVAIEAKSGLTYLARRAVNSPSATSSVTRLYAYEMNMNTFRRAIPILANRADIVINPETPVKVTIGFDDVGLLRFADVEIDNMTATQVAQGLGPRRRVVYHYTLDVTDISGDPIAIDVPKDFVDEPDDTVAADATVDTTPVATP